MLESCSKEQYFEYAYASVDVDVLTTLRNLQDDTPGKFTPYMNSRGWDFDGIFIIKKIRISEHGVETFKTEVTYLFYRAGEFDLSKKINPFDRDSGGEVDWSSRFAGDVPEEFAAKYCKNIDVTDPGALDALLDKLDAEDQGTLPVRPSAEG